MSVYMKLVKVFLSSTEVEEPRQKNQKLFYTIMGIIAICFIMIPCGALIGYLSYGFTFGLDGLSNGIVFLTHFISLFSVAFGITVIINVFYFSGDLQMIMPLPISPAKLIAAKFTAAYISESVMQVFVFIAMVIGFIVAVGVSPMTVIAGIVGIFTLPLAPLVYCGIVCIVLMAFTRLIKNKTAVRRVAWCFCLVIVVIAILMVGMLKDVDVDGFVTAVGDPDFIFMKVMNIVFMGNYWFGQAMEGSVFAFVMYIVYNLVLLAFFMIVAELLYNKGLVAVAAEGSGVKAKKHAGKMKVRSVGKSYIKKEFRNLFRTPAFFVNCFVVNLFWPVIAYAIYVINSDSSVLMMYWIMYKLGSELMRWIVVLLVICITVLMTGMNSLGSSAITREGKYYYVMKYIPIPYEKQLNYKAAVSLIISTAFAWIYIIVASVLLQVPNVSSWYYMLISFLAVVFITYFGLYLDTMNPRLSWDDELNALRGNTNVFFNMALAILICIVFTVIMFAAYYFTKVPVVVMEGVIVVVLIVGDVAMVRKCLKDGAKNIEEMY